MSSPNISDSQCFKTGSWHTSKYELHYDNRMLHTLPNRSFFSSLLAASSKWMSNLLSCSSSAIRWILPRALDIPAYINSTCSPTVHNKRGAYTHMHVWEVWQGTLNTYDPVSVFLWVAVQQTQHQPALAPLLRWSHVVASQRCAVHHPHRTPETSVAAPLQSSSPVWRSWQTTEGKRNGHQREYTYDVDWNNHRSVYVSTDSLDGNLAYP